MVQLILVAGWRRIGAGLGYLDNAHPGLTGPLRLNGSAVRSLGAVVGLVFLFQLGGTSGNGERVSAHVKRNHEAEFDTGGPEASTPVV